MAKKIYVRWDKVAEDWRVPAIIANNGAEAVRILLNQTMQELPLKDVDLYEFELTNERLVEWDAYRYPANQAEALKPLKLTAEDVYELTKKKSEEIDKKLDEKIKEM